MATAGELNERLIERLRATGVLTEPRVAEAFRAVRRHWFLPGRALEAVYEDDAIVTVARGGYPTSSSSQPAIMAIMLQQLLLEPGMRTLEIGTGTGFNAALLAHLAGAEQVTSIELDAEVADSARLHPGEHGLGAVRVVTGDAAAVAAELGTFDRIILTASAWDIAPAWFAALRQGGVMVLPLSLGGPQATIAFLGAGATLVSQSVRPCGFMPVEGIGLGARRRVQQPGGGLRALHEWPESLPDAVLWPAIAAATEPVDLPALSDDSGGAEEAWYALALRGWRVVNCTGDAQLSAIFPPDRPDPVVVAYNPRRATMLPGSTTARELGEELAAWRRAGSPPISRAVVEAEPLAAEHPGEARLWHDGTGRTVIEKQWFRYVVETAT